MGLGQFGEEEAQIAIGLIAVGLGRLDDAVEGGRGVGAVGGIGEEPIASPDDEGADGPFAGVVVDRQASIGEVADEPGPLGVQIGERLAVQRGGWDLGQGALQPGVQLLKDRCGQALVRNAL